MSIKKVFQRLDNNLVLFGIDLKRIGRSIRGIPSFISNYFAIKKQYKNSNKEFEISTFYPCLNDRYDSGGVASGHYFFQDLFISQQIFKQNPIKHVDIGSRVDGFVSHVASFREIEIFDIRNIDISITNITFFQADLMSNNLALSDYCDSISCLHAIEHFGLGRYGDPINYYGYVDGLNNIYKLLKKNGRFYFSTPIGTQRIEFDAHRVFSIKYLISFFSERYEIASFSYVDDVGAFHPFVDLLDPASENNFDCTFGCGIFELIKK